MYLNALGLFLRVHVRGQMDAFGDRLKILAKRLTDRVRNRTISVLPPNLTYRLCCITGPNIFVVKILGNLQLEKCQRRIFINFVVPDIYIMNLFQC